MKTLEITLEKLNRIAELNRQVRARDAKESSSKQLHESFQDYQKRMNNPLNVAMRESVNNLNINELMELSAIVWLARDDFEDFESAYSHSINLDFEQLSGYLSDKPLFEYIPIGIDLVKKEGIILKA